MLSNAKHVIEAYVAREGISFAEVARRLGVSAPTISNMRADKFSPSVGLARRMVDLFGLDSLDAIFGGPSSAEAPVSEQESAS